MVDRLYTSPNRFCTRSRQSQTCVRTLSLAPAAVSMNAVADHLNDDPVSGSNGGLKCVHALGEQIEGFFVYMYSLVITLHRQR